MTCRISRPADVRGGARDGSGPRLASGIGRTGNGRAVPAVCSCTRRPAPCCAVTVPAALPEPGADAAAEPVGRRGIHVPGHTACLAAAGSTGYALGPELEGPGFTMRADGQQPVSSWLLAVGLAQPLCESPAYRVRVRVFVRPGGITVGPDQ
jgi:hypothetical protein